eukprot:6810641-Alexandrium_andersonii.AAC.1
MPGAVHPSLGTPRMTMLLLGLIAWVGALVVVSTWAAVVMPRAVRPPWSARQHPPPTPVASSPAPTLIVLIGL